MYHFIILFHTILREIEASWQAERQEDNEAPREEVPQEEIKEESERDEEKTNVDNIKEYESKVLFIEISYYNKLKKGNM